MQTQVWSNKEILQDFEQCSTLKDVISSLEEKVWIDGEVICEIHVNDLYLNEEEEEKYREAPLNEISKLAIISRTPEELVKESLRSNVEWVPRLKSSALNVAEGFRSLGIEGEKKSFVDLLDGCQWLSESMHLLKPLMFKIVNDDSFIMEWGKCELFFSTVAKESLKAFEQGDIILLSDILEYDLTSGLDKWLQLLSNEPQVQKIIA